MLHPSSRYQSPSPLPRGANGRPNNLRSKGPAAARYVLMSPGSGKVEIAEKPAQAGLDQGAHLWKPSWGSNPGLIRKNPQKPNLSNHTWRREWDSNPRYGFPHTRFPSVRLKPLGYLSGCPVLKVRDDFCKRPAATKPAISATT